MDIHPLDYISLEFQCVDSECRAFSSEDCWGPTCRSCLDCREFNISPGNDRDLDTFTYADMRKVFSKNITLLTSSVHFSGDLNWFFCIGVIKMNVRLNQIKVKCSDCFTEMTKQLVILNGQRCLCLASASVQNLFLIWRHPHNYFG